MGKKRKWTLTFPHLLKVNDTIKRRFSRSRFHRTGSGWSKFTSNNQPNKSQRTAALFWTTHRPQSIDILLNHFTGIWRNYFIFRYHFENVIFKSFCSWYVCNLTFWHVPNSTKYVQHQLIVKIPITCFCYTDGNNLSVNMINFNVINLTATISQVKKHFFEQLKKNTKRKVFEWLSNKMTKWKNHRSRRHHKTNGNRN